MPSGSEHLAVSVRDLSVEYRTTFEKAPTLKGTLRRMTERRRAVRVVKAVQDLSFDVPKGTVLGIVGANGAGKSTLLRTIAGILPPSEGRIEVRGTVSTLLALGVGFNKALSGRENVLLGGLAAGLDPREVAERYDDIVEFAGLGDFIDMPMRAYSSGMYGRLAFSVAIHMEPDILIIDEALSAGDAKFKKKSGKKVKELCKRAGTILLVSHGLATIRDLSTHCMWIDQGRLMQIGDPDEVISAYQEFLEVGEEATTLEDV